MACTKMPTPRPRSQSPGARPFQTSNMRQHYGEPRAAIGCEGRHRARGAPEGIRLPSPPTSWAPTNGSAGSLHRCVVLRLAWLAPAMAWCALALAVLDDDRLRHRAIFACFTERGGRQTSYIACRAACAKQAHMNRDMISQRRRRPQLDICCNPDAVFQT